MANYVVFIDLEHAKIFELHPGKIEEHSMRRHEIRHHNGSEKENNNHKNEEKFFHQVASRLVGAHEVLLVGPGQAKTHFKHHMERHDHEVNKKVVGMETVDHPTDNQIVALAKKFFKAHLQFAE
jgi:stalled ribosome rescue protein Dom34